MEEWIRVIEIQTRVLQIEKDTVRFRTLLSLFLMDNGYLARNGNFHSYAGKLFYQFFVNSISLYFEKFRQKKDVALNNFVKATFCRSISREKKASSSKAIQKRKVTFRQKSK